MFNFIAITALSGLLALSPGVYYKTEISVGVLSPYAGLHNIHVKIVKDDDINAAALSPLNSIYVNSGDKVLSQNEFYFMIAHEMGHLHYKDWGNMTSAHQRVIEARADDFAIQLMNKAGMHRQMCDGGQGLFNQFLKMGSMGGTDHPKTIDRLNKVKHACTL